MKILAMIFLGFPPGLLLAEFCVPYSFSDHMLLQRERPAAIWGRAEHNAGGRISIKENTVATRADAGGKWRTAINTGGADAEDAPQLISADGKSIDINDVVGGEVWFASGQSHTGLRRSKAGEVYDNPVAVRYAKAANPEGASLIKSAGLPASVFRTDDWIAQATK